MRSMAPVENSPWVAHAMTDRAHRDPLRWIICDLMQEMRIEATYANGKSAIALLMVVPFFSDCFCCCKKTRFVTPITRRVIRVFSCGTSDFDSLLFSPFRSFCWYSGQNKQDDFQNICGTVRGGRAPASIRSSTAEAVVRNVSIMSTTVMQTIGAEEEALHYGRNNGTYVLNKPSRCNHKALRCSIFVTKSICRNILRLAARNQREESHGLNLSQRRQCAPSIMHCGKKNRPPGLPVIAVIQFLLALVMLSAKGISL